MNGWQITDTLIQSNFFLIFLQSILELIPTSSSSFIHLFTTDSKNLHLYSGLAMLIIMSKDLVEILLHSQKRIFYILSTLTSVITILLFHNSMPLVSVYKVNITTGVILLCSMIELSSEKFSYGVVDALCIGFFQSLAAIIPGTSRLGMVLTWMFFNGINFTESIQVGYILGIPLNLSASIYENNLSIKPELLFLSLLVTWLFYRLILIASKEHFYLIIIMRIIVFFVLHLI